MPRRSLTPLSSELSFHEPSPGKKSRLERLRRRRKAPTTRRGAIARGLLRLAIWVGVSVAIAAGVNALVNRTTAFGFYVTGAALLAAGFLTSAGGSRPAGYVRSTSGPVASTAASSGSSSARSCSRSAS